MAEDAAIAAGQAALRQATQHIGILLARPGLSYAQRSRLRIVHVRVAEAVACLKTVLDPPDPTKEPIQT